MRAGRRRSWAVLAIVFVLGLAALVGDAVVRAPQPRLGPPATAPMAIVSLGDSTISGEGAGAYQPGTDGQNNDWCHRSPYAEVNDLHLPGVTKTVNLACSGATAADIQLGDATHNTETSQAAQLAATARHYRVTAVVVAIGANDDPHFADLINQCVNAWASHGSCTAGVDAQWQNRVDAMVPKVEKALRDIRGAMTGAGYQTSDYQLVLQSYAAPIGPDVAPGLASLAGCPFRPNDLAWVRQTGVTVLDAGLRQAARHTGTRFLDLVRAGIGHEACSGGTNPASEWFTRLDIVWADLQSDTRAPHALQQSFHPNAAGYAAFAGCLTAFLGTTDAAASCLAGPGGILHPAAEMISPS
jgi:lysophospholipase L1-like esterase